MREGSREKRKGEEKRGQPMAAKERTGERIGENTGGEQKERWGGEEREREKRGTVEAVSYTHLTLPTRIRV